jgi:hypothetical protein
MITAEPEIYACAEFGANPFFPQKIAKNTTPGSANF